MVVDELSKRSIEVITMSTEQLVSRKVQFLKSDLVVGNFDWTRIATKQLGIELPTPPDYPECLSHLLHRAIWRSTLSEVRATIASMEPGA